LVVLRYEYKADESSGQWWDEEKGALALLAHLP
jgi:hypothetical protein